MGRWRNQKGEIHHQDFQATRSSYNNNNNNNKKPPLSNWQPTVPKWEKKFCTSVGAVPWSKLLETKRNMYMYDNIVQWNDSAGEEAFHNAKNRFWAEINDFPCNIPLPDPDTYIEEIDWNSKIDPELLLDLEKEPNIPNEMKKSEEVVILGDSVLNPAFSYSCTGWGDAEENFQKADEDEKFWEKDYVHNDGDTKDKSQGWDRWDCNDDWDNQHTENNTVDWRTTGEYLGAGYENNRNGGDSKMSRYKTTRFYHDDHPVNHGGRGKRVDFRYDNPQTETRFPSNRWNVVNSCQPVGHY
jgi:hypothetical protein